MKHLIRKFRNISLTSLSLALSSAFFVAHAVTTTDNDQAYQITTRSRGRAPDIRQSVDNLENLTKLNRKISTPGLKSMVKELSKKKHGRHIFKSDQKIKETYQDDLLASIEHDAFMDASSDLKKASKKLKRKAKGTLTPTRKSAESSGRSPKKSKAKKRLEFFDDAVKSSTVSITADINNTGIESIVPDLSKDDRNVITFHGNGDVSFEDIKSKTRTLLSKDKADDIFSQSDYEPSHPQIRGVSWIDEEDSTLEDLVAVAEENSATLWHKVSLSPVPDQIKEVYSLDNLDMERVKKLDGKICFFDFETSLPLKCGTRVIEWALCFFDNLKVSETIHFYTHIPNLEWNPFYECHGLSAQFLKNQSKIHTYMDHIEARLVDDNPLLVAYNGARFDLPLLNDEIVRARIVWRLQQCFETNLAVPSRYELSPEKRRIGHEILKTHNLVYDINSHCQKNTAHDAEKLASAFMMWRYRDYLRREFRSSKDEFGNFKANAFMFRGENTLPNPKTHPKNYSAALDALNWYGVIHMKLKTQKGVYKKKSPKNPMSKQGKQYAKSAHVLFDVVAELISASVIEQNDVDANPISQTQLFDPYVLIKQTSFFRPGEISDQKLDTICRYYDISVGERTSGGHGAGIDTLALAAVTARIFGVEDLFKGNLLDLESKLFEKNSIMKYDTQTGKRIEANLLYDDGFGKGFARKQLQDDQTKKKTANPWNIVPPTLYNSPYGPMQQSLRGADVFTATDQRNGYGVWGTNPMFTHQNILTPSFANPFYGNTATSNQMAHVNPMFSALFSLARAASGFQPNMIMPNTAMPNMTAPNIATPNIATKGQAFTSPSGPYGHYQPIPQVSVSLPQLGGTQNTGTQNIGTPDTQTTASALQSRGTQFPNQPSGLQTNPSVFSQGGTSIPQGYWQQPYQPFQNLGFNPAG